MRLRFFLIASFVAALAPGAAWASEPSLKVFGSIGNEAHFRAPDDDSPLNPGNFLDVPQRGNSADVTAFFDLRPEGSRWKVHAKLRATDEDRPGHTTRGELGELYGQFNIRSWLDLTVGRRIEKWGTGYAWNPTGFVNPPKNPGDPNDRLNAYRGNDMIRADLFVHDVNISAFVLPRLSSSDGAWHGAGKTDYALRVYKLIGGTDLSLHYKRGSEAGGPLRNSTGISFAHVIGDALEIHGEAASVADARASHPEILLGGQYTFGNGLNVVVEMEHDGAGLPSAQWNSFRNGVDDAGRSFRAGDPGPLLDANLSYTPLQMGRNYAFLRTAWPVVRDRFDVEEIALVSLRDGSTFLRSALSWKAWHNVSIYVLETEFFAGHKSEFDYVQVRRLFDAGVRFYF